MRNYIELPTITNQQLDFWWKTKVNVLIYGDHGVGKTSIIRNHWENLKINYVMLSGATLDPWTDLVGIPTKVMKKDKSVIEYALPQTMDENLEAIFIDEINRAPAKVRNALMELLLTKSINGRKFPKLRVIWGAANPPDSNNNYDVEELDPAQEDRFEVIVKLSDKPYLPYFSEKYGQGVAEKAIGWHGNLTDEIRSFVSPRRLDFALDYVVIKGGNARDIFPHKSINVASFVKAVKGDKRMEELIRLVSDKDEISIREFFLDESKVQGCLKDILRDSKYAKFLAQYGNMEELMSFAEAEPRLALLLSETSRADKNKAIDDYRKIHGFDPRWHSEGFAKSNTARSATALFVRELEFFPKPSLVEVKIPDLISLLDFKGEEEVLEDFPYPRGLVISPIDRDSAINGIRFGIKLFGDGLVNTMDKESQFKLYSLIYSSFNFYYERDGNLVGAFYDVPNSELTMKMLPQNLRPALQNTSPKLSNAMRGRKGVSLGEEIL